MKIEIVERNYKAKDRLKEIIEKKLTRFDKFLSDGASAKVVLTCTHDRYKMETSVSDKGLFIRSEVETDNMYANVDLCLAKIERQIVKHSDKLEKRNKFAPVDLMFFDELPIFEEGKIVKRKKVELAPMSEKEAIEQIELTDHDFYVFLNEKTQKICVLYAREERGEYGIIETNM